MPPSLTRSTASCEFLERRDPVFQQVPHAALARREQFVGVRALDVLAEQQHAHRRHAPTELDGRAHALVAERGRHAHVEHGEVGPGLVERGEQRVGLAVGGDGLETGLVEEPYEPLAQQHRILGEHDAKRAARGVGHAPRLSAGERLDAAPAEPTRRTARRPERPTVGRRMPRPGCRECARRSRWGRRRGCRR